VLRCHTDYAFSGYISWYRRVVGGTKEHIVSRCMVQREFRSVYNVTSDGAGQCDLVISSVDASLTGVYICQEVINIPDTADAYLTLIGEYSSTRSLVAHVVRPILHQYVR